jgi:phosphate transport system substrate-binding protein
MKILLTLFFTFISLHAQGRDHIRIMGSSTLYPFITVAAEKFGKTSGFTPIVESTGTGGGFNLLCTSKNLSKAPDIINASRAITSREMALCTKNGIKPLKEIQIGFGGIAIAEAKTSQLNNLSEKQLFLALSKQLPSNGKMVDNFYTKWQQIDSNLPNYDIVIYGPSMTSGTRDVINDLLIKKFGGIRIREDKHYIEMPEDNNLIIQKLIHNEQAIGIIGFNFLSGNQKIKAISINGIMPSYQTITMLEYSLSRPLFIYVNYNHIKSTRGLKAFITELTSKQSVGKDGYLTQRGLITPTHPSRINP